MPLLMADWELIFFSFFFRPEIPPGVDVVTPSSLWSSSRCESEEPFELRREWKTARFGLTSFLGASPEYGREKVFLRVGITD